MSMTNNKWARLSSILSAIMTRQDEINDLITDMVNFLTDEETNNDLEADKKVLGCIRCAKLERELRKAVGVNIKHTISTKKEP